MLTSAIIGAVGSLALVAGLVLGWILRNESRLATLEALLKGLREDVGKLQETTGEFAESARERLSRLEGRQRQ